MVDGRRESDYPKPEKEKTALRSIIRAVNPDVLALQEIGGSEYVEELKRDLAAEGSSYPFIATVAGPDGKRQLAILSRKPFKSTTPISAIPVRYKGTEGHVSRGLLAVSFDTEAGELTLYTLHLKSRLTVDKSDPEAVTQRNAEATAIRNLVRARHAADPQALFLICGDFNDQTTSGTLRRFTNIGQASFLTMLPVRDSRGETWTYRNRRDDYYSRSDYILCSPALIKTLDSAKNATVANHHPSGRIVDIPGTDIASDHRMVYVDIILPTSTKAP
jgi:endonuclease/exonuclease/phosphatase family metal-dependent hydrolase